MTISEHMNNLLKFIKDPLSVVELSNAKCLPPVLQVSNIALLMYPDSIKLQEHLTFTLKKMIEQKNLPAITLEEFSHIIADHESRRDTAEYLNDKTGNKSPALTLTAVAHADSDLLPEDIDVNSDERLMYVVHRKDMKKWLEGENDWPLPEDNLLSRWWPEVNLEGKALPLTADALESSAAGKDVKKLTDAASAEKLTAENLFRKEGQMWVLRYNGETIYLKHTKGLLYISYLIGSPFQRYHVAELVKAAENLQQEYLTFSSGNISTKKDFTKYRERLTELRNAVADAQRKGEQPLVYMLLQEQDALTAQMKQMIGIGGKLKENTNEAKKQAKAVSSAIARSLKEIERNHKALARHLNNTISRGEFVSYFPETDISWITTK